MATLREEITLNAFNVNLTTDPATITTDRVETIWRDFPGETLPDLGTPRPSEVAGRPKLLAGQPVRPEDAVTGTIPELRMIGAILLARQSHPIEDVEAAILTGLAPLLPSPTPDPTPEPTPDPTPEPTPEPTPDPTPDPTPEPTP